MSWRETIERLGIRPSRELGQNFLHDRRVVERIAETARLAADDLVLEIGPGLGVLTAELAKRVREVIAVEIDPRLAAHLRTMDFPAHVQVVQSDILQVDIAELTGKRPFVVVANLPYSIAAAAIQRLLEGEARPARMVVMVQREVAERIVAQPPEMSILAVGVQFFARPTIAFRIGPGAFIPAPKVESAVVSLDVHPQLPLLRSEWAAFFQIVRAGFGQRRKQLINALTDGLDLRRGEVEQCMVAANVSPARRAETLNLDEWLRLYRSFHDGT